jgi:hypothetical protein
MLFLWLEENMRIKTEWTLERTGRHGISEEIPGTLEGEWESMPGRYVGLISGLVFRVSATGEAVRLNETEKQEAERVLNEEGREREACEEALTCDLAEPSFFDVLDDDCDFDTQDFNRYNYDDEGSDYLDYPDYLWDD